MVTVELGGDVIVSRGHVEQVFVWDTDFTPMNLIGGQVGQRVAMIYSVVAGMLVSVTAEPDPVIVVGGQVEQGL